MEIGAARTKEVQENGLLMKQGEGDGVSAEAAAADVGTSRRLLSPLLMLLLNKDTDSASVSRHGIGSCWVWQVEKRGRWRNGLSKHPRQSIGSVIVVDSEWEVHMRLK